MVESRSSGACRGGAAGRGGGGGECAGGVGARNHRRGTDRVRRVGSGRRDGGLGADDAGELGRRKYSRSKLKVLDRGSFRPTFSYRAELLEVVRAPYHGMGSSHFTVGKDVPSERDKNFK
jgi:hypothetical protein